MGIMAFGAQIQAICVGAFKVHDEDGRSGVQGLSGKSGFQEKETRKAQALQGAK